MPKFNPQELYKFFAKLSRKERMIFYAAAAVVSVMLLDRLIISPVFSKIKSLDEEIREKESAIRKNVKMLTQKDRIQASRADYGAFVGGRLGSDEEEMTSFMKEMEDLASKSSVYLVDIKPGAVKSQEQLKKYFITLNCEAQMEQVVDFMYGLENSSRLFTIERYQITPKAKDSSLARCSISVSKTFIR